MEVSVPSYFQHLAMLLTDAKIAEIYTSGSWKNVTNRAVYEYHVNLLESPKIELDLLGPQCHEHGKDFTSLSFLLKFENYSFSCFTINTS